MILNEFQNKLTEMFPKSKVKLNESLSNYTYTKVGGNAEALIFPETYEDIKKIYSYANENNIPITLLGNGSNVLIKETGIKGIVLIMTHMINTQIQGNKIICQSGASIIDVSRVALENELTGLEFACGIPGSIGGAIYMNAGAYGGEVSEVLESVKAIDENGDIIIFTKDELNLEYRKSAFQENGFLILEVTFKLETGEFKEIKEKMEELTYLRELKQPLEYPSCGSVFKRPPGMFAGQLIQESGLQGATIGGAQVSKKHAGFIVNIGGATTNDYLDLIQFVQKEVNKKFNVNLETEVRVIGD